MYHYITERTESEKVSGEVAGNIPLQVLSVELLRQRYTTFFLDGRIEVAEILSTSGLVWYGGSIGGCAAVV